MKRLRFGSAVVGMLCCAGTEPAAQAQTPSRLPAWMAESDQAHAGLGSAVSTAGDVNGDGYDDVLAGAFAFDNGETDEGRAYLFLGSADGPSKLPDWTAECDQAFARLGEALSTAGDVNGDGYDDVIVGARGFDNSGRAFVYHGSPAGLASSPAWFAAPGAYEFGYAVASAGDVNGDGFDDVVVGAIGATNGQAFEGQAFLYLGSPSGLAAAPAWIADGDQAHSAFGGVVAGAGDVNGDGFDDVLVSALQFNNGQNDEGRATLYLGSAAGLAASAAWSVEGNQANAWLGDSLSAAGDVNADGFADVLVGATGFDAGQSDEGVAYLYLGSAAGLATSPAWRAEGNQRQAFFGRVSSAGDLDGDGYGDVIVGGTGFSNGQTNEGRVFAYHGSASGLTTRPSWSVESNQRNPDFGLRLAAAGDVDGDGFDDVLVGANRFHHGQPDEGRVFAYLGAPRVRLGK